MLEKEIKNKFLIFNIQKNYKFLSNYLTCFQKHIEICYNTNYISLYQRNIVIGKIYELVKELNTEYNDFIINKIDDNCNLLDKYLDIKLKNDNDSTFYVARNYLKNIYNMNFNKDINLILYPLDFKRSKIIEISQKYGCNSIKLILEIL